MQTVLQEVTKLTTPRTRIIINSYSRLREPISNVAQWLGLAKSALYQNWLTVDDIGGLLTLIEYDVIRSWQESLWTPETTSLSSPKLRRGNFREAVHFPVRMTLCLGSYFLETVLSLSKTFLAGELNWFSRSCLSDIGFRRCFYAWCCPWLELRVLPTH